VGEGCGGKEILFIHAPDNRAKMARTMRTECCTFALFLAAFASGPAFAQAGPSDEERDFVPGEKTVFFDDFTDMARGAAPPHWKVRGGVARLSPDGRLLLSGRGTLFANLKSLPKNYTVETEIVPTNEVSSGGINWMFTDAADESVWCVGFQFDTGELTVSLMTGHGHSDYEGHPHMSLKVEYGKPVHLAVWFQDSRIRGYVNGQRAFDVNQVEFKPSTVALMEFNVEDVPTYIISARIAESMPDISKNMFSSGRYVSHNILFDVNSDQLRPESMNVIKEIAAALAQQANLKVRIEGHTDSTGDAAKNLDLSKRRAESVKSALVKLGIAADRMTTDGLGQTKPSAPNDTPEGRAENRRVEFVKL
jgi:outer membrane protein OmpA-like peptidoglycan-associated protein